ncbi:MAG: ribosome recycling factor [Bacilli bacterium]|nr:ribosome recycling factor [Bacilli bacterium]
MMDDILLETEEGMQNAITNLENRFTNIRAGRANPAMLDGVKVEYYGAMTPLNQLANVSVPEARKLQVKPFDKSALNNIEKAIYEANLGLTPNNTGDVIFITIPELTEDRRKELVKQAKIMAEEARIALRNVRANANNNIKKLELNEDEEKRSMNEVQDLINEYNKKVDQVLEEKEKELMTV